MYIAQYSVLNNIYIYVISGLSEIIRFPLFPVFCFPCFLFFLHPFTNHPSSPIFGICTIHAPIGHQNMVNVYIYIKSIHKTQVFKQSAWIQNKKRLYIIYINIYITYIYISYMYTRQILCLVMQLACISWHEPSPCIGVFSAQNWQCLFEWCIIRLSTKHTKSRTSREGNEFKKADDVVWKLTKLHILKWFRKCSVYMFFTWERSNCWSPSGPNHTSTGILYCCFKDVFTTCGQHTPKPILNYVLL